MVVFVIFDIVLPACKATYTFKTDVSYSHFAYKSEFLSVIIFIPSSFLKNVLLGLYYGEAVSVETYILYVDYKTLPILTLLSTILAIAVIVE